MTSGTVYARRGIRQDKWNSNTHRKGVLVRKCGTVYTEKGY